MANHNCLRDTRTLAIQNQNAIQELRRENNDLKRALQEMAVEQQALRDLLLNSGPSAGTSNSSHLRTYLRNQPTSAVASDSAAISVASCALNIL